MRKLLALFCVFTALSVQVTCAQATRDVLASIVHNNLQLQALRHQFEAEVQDLKSENRPEPFSVEYSPFYERGYDGTAESELIISQEFDFPTLYAARARQNQLQRASLDEQYDSARRELLFQAHQLCCDVIRMNQYCAMQHRRLENIERAIRFTEELITRGDATILDLNRLKLERMEVHAADAQNESERTQLLGQLQALNGGQPIQLADTSYVSLAELKDAFVETAYVANHPSVRTAQAEVAVANQQLTVSRQSWLPSLNLGYRRNTSYRDHVDGMLLGAAFPLYGSSNKVKAARLRQQSAQLQLDDARQQAQTEYQSRVAELSQLRQVLAAFDPDLLHQTLGLLATALEHGQISALQYHTDASDIYQRFETYISLCCQCAKLESELAR